jgi:hypothetical protein
MFGSMHNRDDDKRCDRELNDYLDNVTHIYIKEEIHSNVFNHSYDKVKKTNALTFFSTWKDRTVIKTKQKYIRKLG